MRIRVSFLFCSFSILTNTGNIEYEIPIPDALNGQKAPRRPKSSKDNQAAYRPASANIKRTVSFNNVKSSNSGIISTISGVKDLLFKYVLGKQPSKSILASSGVKNTIQRRQPVINSSYEMDLHILNQEKKENEQEIMSDDYFLAVMKENARLRSQVLQMRQSQKKIPGSFEQEPVASSKKSTENSQNLKIWMERQARLVNEPESLSSSETGDYGNTRNFANATSIAAAVAAGVTAAHQATSKTARRKRVNAENVVATNSNHTAKVSRDDSGVKLTAPNSREPSRDHFSPKNFVKPNSMQMKHENDRLAKALGLI